MNRFRNISWTTIILVCIFCFPAGVVLAILKDVRVKLKENLQTFKRSSFFFFSRIASSVFTATNTLILGIKFGKKSVLVGHYSSAEKAITIAKQTITPVSDSLYPYMVRNRNFKMIKKLLLIGMPVFFVGCTFVMITANDLEAAILLVTE